MPVHVLIVEDEPELLRRLAEALGVDAPLLAWRGGNPRAVETAETAGAPAADVPRLSDREAQILRLLAKGLVLETVGQVLGISSHTVVTHVKKIYRKLGVHSRAEAVYEAGQIGLL